MDFYKLLKFLHILALIIGIFLLAGSIYLTVDAWPEKPAVDPKLFWIAINFAFLLSLAFVLTKAWPYRPKIGLKAHPVKRVSAPEEKAIVEHWRSIRERAFSRDPNQIKLAILEADKMVNEILTTVGFTGETTGDKINQILADELGWIRRATMKAHAYRNRLADEESSEIDPEEVKKAIHNYEVLLKEMDVIDPAEL